MQTYSEQWCSRMIGLPVCAILHDGVRHFGIISRASGGKLVLNDPRPSNAPEAQAIVRQRKPSRRGKVANRSGRPRRSASTTKLTAHSTEPTTQAPPSPQPLFSEKTVIELKRIARIVPLF